MSDAAPFIHPTKRYRLFFDETGNGDLYAAKKDANGVKDVFGKLKESCEACHENHRP